VNARYFIIKVYKQIHFIVNLSRAPAKHMRDLAVGGVSVCPPVCPSVTRWYWLKTNNRRITRFSRRLDHGL